MPSGDIGLFTNIGIDVRVLKLQFKCFKLIGNNSGKEVSRLLLQNKFSKQLGNLFISSPSPVGISFGNSVSWLKLQFKYTKDTSSSSPWLFQLSNSSTKDNGILNVLSSLLLQLKLCKEEQFSIDSGNSVSLLSEQFKCINSAGKSGNSLRLLLEQLITIKESGNFPSIRYSSKLVKPNSST